MSSDEVGTLMGGCLVLTLSILAILELVWFSSSQRADIEYRCTKLQSKSLSVSEIKECEIYLSDRK